MHNEFEANFRQNVQSNLPKVNQSSKKSKTHLIITILLAVALLLESIFLGVVLLRSNASDDNLAGDIDDASTIAPASEQADNDYGGEKPLVYDDDLHLSAFELTCTAESSATFSFTKNNTYQEKTSAGTTSSGTYSVSNDSLVSLSTPNGSDRVLYFDGLFVADGLTVYDCVKE